jgi:hypothetical protein
LDRVATLSSPDLHWLRLLKAIGIGFLISFVCAIPPIIHFVTGPVGPALGGFIGGGRSEASGSDALFIGAGMSLCWGLLLTVVSFVVYLVASSMAPGMLSQILGTVPIALVIIMVYVGLVGTIGAFTGGRQARAKLAEQQAVA